MRVPLRPRDICALIIVGAFTLMLALHLFLRKTMLGSTIIAMAQSREGAFLVGIDDDAGRHGANLVAGVENRRRPHPVDP